MLRAAALAALAPLASLGLAASEAGAQSVPPRPGVIEERIADAIALFETEGFQAFCLGVSDRTGPYMVDEAYVFALTRGGDLVCHPRPDLLRIPTGRPSAAPRMMRNAENAKPEGAWTHYRWPHPDSLQLDEKSTFCRVADPLIICAGGFLGGVS